MLKAAFDLQDAVGDSDCADCESTYRLGSDKAFQSQLLCEAALLGGGGCCMPDMVRWGPEKVCTVVCALQVQQPVQQQELGQQGKPQSTELQEFLC